MTQTIFDRLYPERPFVQFETCPDLESKNLMPWFRGLPVLVRDTCVTRIHSEKRWKRLNRPNKVRTRDFDLPGVFIVDKPLVPCKSIVCHPKVFEKMQSGACI